MIHGEIAGNLGSLGNILDDDAANSYMRPRANLDAIPNGDAWAKPHVVTQDNRAADENVARDAAALPDDAVVPYAAEQADKRILANLGVTRVNGLRHNSIGKNIDSAAQPHASGMPNRQSPAAPRVDLHPCCTDDRAWSYLHARFKNAVFRDHGIGSHPHIIADLHRMADHGRRMDSAIVPHV